MPNHPENRPPVPSPYAQPHEIHDFLVKFFLALDYRQDIDEAIQKADLSQCDGRMLYNTCEEDWRNRYGIQGAELFLQLQSSKFGAVRTP